MTNTLTHVWRSMRPRQWIKNLFIFAPLVFVRAFFDLEKVVAVVAAFILFSFASSAVYLANDIADREKDRVHPTKKKRPIASGELSPIAAAIAAAALAVISLAGAFYLQSSFGLVILGYLLLNLLYSFALKRLLIVDVFSIALGFVLRVVGGAAVIGVPVSVWILLCTFFLTLFLAINKRKAEQSVFGAEARFVLGAYPPLLLEQMNTVSLSATIIAYALYTFNSEHSRLLMATIPVALYGLFYYLYASGREDTSDPTDIVLSKRPLQIAIAVWALSSFAILLFTR